MKNTEFTEDNYVDYSGACDDPVRMYLNEINAYPSLDQEGEVELFRAYKAGDMTARENLINSSLKLSVSIAKKYKGRGAAFLDLIQEGNMGIIKAVDMFDESRGYRFSTYAVFWIRHYITRYLNEKARIIRNPVYIEDLLYKYNKLISEYMLEYGEEPSEDYILDKLDITESKLENLKGLKEPLSLDCSYSQEGETTLIDCIVDDFSTSPESVAEYNALRESIDYVLSKLPKKEQYVIKNRFGLDGYDTKTLEVIGQELGLSRERIRQIEKSVLDRLSDEHYGSLLREYVA